MNNAGQDVNDTLSSFPPLLPDCDESSLPFGSPCNSSSLTTESDSAAQIKPNNNNNQREQIVIAMKPNMIDTGNRLYLQYEPMNGVQTASILGSCLLLVILYIVYKAKCRKSSWTSEDQLYLERYRRKFHNQYKKNNRLSRASSHWSTGKDSMRESLAMENTAKWIQSQPLNTSIPKKTIKTVSNMCNICIDSCHSATCPMCSNSDIHSPVPPGATEASCKPADPFLPHKVNILPEPCCQQQTSRDTRLIENDIHHSLNEMRKKSANNITQRLPPNYKNSNMEQENLLLYPLKEKRAKPHEADCHVERPNHLVPPNSAQTDNGRPLRLDQCRSQCSSLSDSIDLDKHIDFGIHNTSPELHRAMVPKLKYIPLFTLPVTNISFIQSTNVSPKSPLCDIESLSGSKGSQEPPMTEDEELSLERKRSGKPKKSEMRDADGIKPRNRKTVADGIEGISLKELGKGLKYIDSAEEPAEDDVQSPLKLSVSNL